MVVFGGARGVSALVPEFTPEFQSGSLHYLYNYVDVSNTDRVVRKSEARVARTTVRYAVASTADAPVMLTRGFSRRRHMI